jgi:hypothetical protein
LVLKPGVVVKIKGLTGAAQYNGKQGLVMDEAGERWSVVSSVLLVLLWCVSGVVMIVLFQC